MGHCESLTRSVTSWGYASSGGALPFGQSTEETQLALCKEGMGLVWRLRGVPWDPLGPTLPSPSGNENGCRGCSSKTSPSTKADKVIHLGVRSRGGKTKTITVPVPPTSWQARQTDHPAALAALDRLLAGHTDAQVAKMANLAGHGSGTGQAFTPRIVLRLCRFNGLPTSND